MRTGNHRRRVLAMAFGVFGLLGAGSCGESTAANPMLGTYTLVAVGDQALPVTSDGASVVEGQVCYGTILSGRLTLSGESGAGPLHSLRYERRLRVDYACPETGRRFQQTRHLDGAYLVHPDSAMTFVPDHAIGGYTEIRGRLRADTVWVAWGSSGEVYRRND